MKQVDVKCLKCGKITSMNVGEGTAILRCECGAETTLKGESGKFSSSQILFEQLQKILLEKVPELIDSYKENERKGLLTGIDEGLHEMARAQVRSVIEASPALKEALRGLVKDALECSLLEHDHDHEG